MSATILPDIRRRIVNAKWILERAARMQDECTDMGFAVSLLLMHDAAEMLMLAVLDHLQVPVKKKREFMDFWPDLKQAGHPEAPDRLPLESLNKLRVGFKHNGNLPHPKEVRNLMARLRGFFENALEVYCQLSYADVSLADLVQYENVRTLLLNAQKQFSSGDKQGAMMSLGEALHRLEQHQERKFLYAPRMPHLPTEMRQFERHIEPVYSFLRDSATTTNLLILGIDPRQYTKFLRQTPLIQWSAADTSTVIHRRTYESDTEEMFSEMVDFLVDYSIKIQEA